MIKEEWGQALNREFDKLYFKKLMRFIKNEREAGKEIYPAQKDVFKAFNYTLPAFIKVVIIGQDPYHTPGYADGLAFSASVSKGTPPSLQNILKELKDDLGHETPNSGSLMQWARRGVLLLNSVLTVEAGKPGSHRNLGWERFTDEVIAWLNLNKSPIVFMLWGRDAISKEHLIRNSKHCVIKSSHPSPFSAHKSTDAFQSFLGSKPFSSANKFLAKPIDWSLSNRL